MEEVKDAILQCVLIEIEVSLEETPKIEDVPALDLKVRAVVRIVAGSRLLALQVKDRGELASEIAWEKVGTGSISYGLW
jgi:hypothetical protein